MRYWLLIGLGGLLSGCADRTPTSPNFELQPGDQIRPEISYAPIAPWKTGRPFTIGVMAKVERPGRETHYLRDEQVAMDDAITIARVTFMIGDQPHGDSREFILVHDC